MSRILNAVSVLNSEPETDAIDQLFTVAKKFKPLPVPEEMRPDPDFHMEAEGSYPIPLEMCDVDPSYQRPLDRDKVAAMKRDKAWEKQPIHVNMDGGTYWIIDGQHRAEAARQSGVKEVQAFVDMMPSQDEAEHETGVMAKASRDRDGAYSRMDSHVPWPCPHCHAEAHQPCRSVNTGKKTPFPQIHIQRWKARPSFTERTGVVLAKTFQSGEDCYECHVLPSQEPTLIETLEGMGAEREVSKVETYGWHGNCYVVRCGAGTITYVPHDAVEKDAGAILTLPERGLLRFDGLTEDEVQFVLKTIALDVAPVDPPPPAPHAGAKPLGEVLNIEGDVEILAEGIGGRTWPADWVWMDDGGVAVFNDHATLAYYPVISRHPTGEGDWRLIGPKHDLTVRSAPINP